MTPTPVIGLLTDFGTRDSYVAQMKGVILSSCDATIVDLTHEIAPFDVFGAGIFLREVAPRFESTIRRPVVLVAVVDPGVGSSRRILAAEWRGLICLAPDNGILPVALDEPTRVVDVADETFFLKSGSATFHGRDRFAPVAAALARGTRIEDLGPGVDPGSMVDLGYRPPDHSSDTLIGQVVRVDRFGNIVTDLNPDAIGAFRALGVGRAEVADRASTYAEKAGTDAPFLIIGSTGTFEISVSNGSAAGELGVDVRDLVSVLRD